MGVGGGCNVLTHAVHSLEYLKRRVLNDFKQGCGSEMICFGSDSGSGSDFNEVSAPTPATDPDPVSVPPRESCAANSHFIREITTIYKV